MNWGDLAQQKVVDTGHEYVFRGYDHGPSPHYCSLLGTGWFSDLLARDGARLSVYDNDGSWEMYNFRADSREARRSFNEAQRLACRELPGGAMSTSCGRPAAPLGPPVPLASPAPTIPHDPNGPWRGNPCRCSVCGGR